MLRKEKVFEERERKRDGERCNRESVTLKNPQNRGNKVEIVVAQLVKELKLKKTKKWVEE